MHSVLPPPEPTVLRKSIQISNVNSRSNKLTSERLQLLLQFMKGVTLGILRNNYLLLIQSLY